MNSLIKEKVVKFLKNEDGNQSVELAILFPIMLIFVGFITDRFITNEGVTAVASAANEAIRYSVVAPTQSNAQNVIKDTLSDRMESSNIGWCTGNTNNSCRKWGSSIKTTSDESVFDNDKSYQLLIHVDEKGWCNGSYIKLGVRAHKSSLIPSYETFKHMVRQGGPIFHTHTYKITARVESNNKCS